MQIYFVYRLKHTYVIILYFHFLQNYECVFCLRGVFLMLLFDEYFLEPFDQVGILLRTRDFFLVNGQSHYDMKNHYLYM